VARPIPQSEYSIAAVSKLTGVSCHALRVWERRYGYPKPSRSESNQRRYGLDQVRVLQALSSLVYAGRPIGELIADFKAGRLTFELPPEEAAAESPENPSMIVVDQLLAGDLDAADESLARLAERFSKPEMLATVYEAALIEVGERWFRGTASVFQEHFATSVIIRKLGRLLDDARAVNVRPAHRAIVGAVQGDRHEGGVLILSTMLELSGWRTLTLGVDIPVDELRRAVEAWRPDAIGVSLVLSRNINKRFQELALIRGIPVFVGGRSLMNHKGLARRYGLIPLAGPVSITVPLWIEEFQRRLTLTSLPQAAETSGFEMTKRHPSTD
jgi:methanogenic corrinoid protein MtbC1